MYAQRVTAPQGNDTDAGDGAVSSTLRAFIEALGHPVRAKIIFALTDRAQSAGQIAATISEPARAVRHHLSKMAARGLVSVSHSEERRGALERYYAMSIPPFVDEAEHELLGLEEARKVAVGAMRGLVEVANRALAAGTFDRRPGSTEVLVNASLDRRGWEEVSAICRETYEGVERLKRDAACRLEQSGEEPIVATSAIVWFERPGIER